MIGRQELCSLIPHKGKMCLLDEVVDWDEGSIQCRTDSHRRSDNPLRDAYGLAAPHLIEYGAQAAAVHGGLIGRDAGYGVRPGYIAAVRQVQLSVDWLQDLEGPLNVEAERLVGDEHSVIYQFVVRSGKDLLATGRVTVVSRQEEAERT